MEAVVTFVTTMLISFAGSLQPGPLNMSVLYRTRNNGVKAGTWVAVGGMFPELFYSAAAIGAASILIKFQGILDAVSVISIFVFLATGVFLLAGKSKSKPNKVRSTRLFMEGFFAGITNAQLFLFWIGVSTLLMKWNYLTNNNVFSFAAFIAGAASGAFVLQLLLITATHKSTFLKHILTGIRLNRITGIVFIIFAIISAIRIL